MTTLHPDRVSGRALFIDRDGVVNRDGDYVHRVEDFHFQPGIFDLVRHAPEIGYAPVVITNQSGIARGYYDEAAYLALDGWMRQRFAEEGADIAATYFCPYHPSATVERYRHPAHPWRKPAPGMLLQARDDLGLDLAASCLIGDRWSDALAGAAAGVPHLALIGDRADDEGAPNHPPDVTRLASLADALPWLDALGAV